ncbi:hypothetical protein CISIN_1g0140561mg, partial [Citrus sinensis]
QTVVANGEGNKSKEPMKTQYVQKADNRKLNAATNEAATHTNAETSEAQNEVITTEATHVISSDAPAVADGPPQSTVTLPSVVRASPEPTCSDIVPVVDKDDSGFSTPVVTAASSMATTSTPIVPLGMAGSALRFRDAPSTEVMAIQCAPIGKSHRIEEYSNYNDEFCGDDRCGNSDSERVEDAVIQKLGDQRIIRCSEGFIEVTPQKNFKINRRRRRRY